MRLFRCVSISCHILLLSFIPLALSVPVSLSGVGSGFQIRIREYYVALPLGVGYAPPAITAVFSPARQLLSPTTGGVVTVIGSNFGSATCYDPRRLSSVQVCSSMHTTCLRGCVPGVIK